jgi:hypothetical protein
VMTCLHVPLLQDALQTLASFVTNSLLRPPSLHFPLPLIILLMFQPPIPCVIGIPAYFIETFVARLQRFCSNIAYARTSPLLGYVSFCQPNALLPSLTPLHSLSPTNAI